MQTLLGELPHLAYFAHTVAAIQSPALAQSVALPLPRGDTRHCEPAFT